MSGITSQVATVDYLQLLTVQLQNQDPIDPADQEGLIRDLAQFSTLEGIEDLNTSFAEMLKFQELSQGLEIVGKEVDYIGPTGERKSGTASEIFNSGSEVRVLVNGDSISLSNVTNVRQPAA